MRRDRAPLCIPHRRGGFGSDGAEYGRSRFCGSRRSDRRAAPARPRSRRVARHPPTAGLRATAPAAPPPPRAAGPHCAGARARPFVSSRAGATSASRPQGSSAAMMRAPDHAALLQAHMAQSGDAALAAHAMSVAHAWSLEALTWGDARAMVRLPAAPPGLRARARARTRARRAVSGVAPAGAFHSARAHRVLPDACAAACARVLPLSPRAFLGTACRWAYPRPVPACPPCSRCCPRCRCPRSGPVCSRSATWAARACTERTV